MCETYPRKSIFGIKFGVTPDDQAQAWSLISCAELTRHIVHYAVRRVKWDERDVVRQRFADSIVTDRSRDFWLELKKYEWEGL
jgi:hypothetical protein